MTLQQGVELVDLQFRYGGAAAAASSPLLLDGFTLSLPPGARCLLVGANGAGKTTLLQVVAGHHMVPPSAVTVLGRPAFHDTSLVSGGDLSYLGAAWRRDVAFAGYGVPLQGDLGAGEILSRVPGVDPQRREKLIRLLGIDPSWRLLRLSDGQRRRVQVAMGLLRPFRVLLLDEVTVDMDVLGRLDLLRFLYDECETRGAIVVYATHIFDGLQGWATHLAHVSRGKLLRGGKIEEVAPEMTGGGGGGGLRKGEDDDVGSSSHSATNPKLLTVVEAWLRSERDEARAEAAAAAKEKETREKENAASSTSTASTSTHEADAARKRDAAPNFPSRQMAFFR